MKRHLICYDIRDPKRLARVRRMAYAYAYGGQRSALEAPLSAKEARELHAKLEALIDPAVDSLLIVPVSEEAILLGCARQLDLDEDGVIIL